MKKRILSLLLCCCLLAGVFQPQKARAFVIADDLAAAGGVALVASFLVAGGAAFSTNDDLQAVANDIYTRYIQPSAPLLEEVSGLVKAWYKGVGSGVVCCANISQRLWSAVCGDPVAENVASGNYGTGSHIVTRSTLFSEDSDEYYGLKWCKKHKPNRCVFGGHVYTLTAKDYGSYTVYRVYCDGELVSNVGYTDYYDYGG